MEMAMPVSDMMLEADAELVHQDEGEMRMEAGSGRVTMRMLRKWKRKRMCIEGHEEDLLGERVLEGVDGTPDQVAAVVEGFDQVTPGGRPGARVAIRALTS
jgi:hypothetical protein